MVGPYNFSIFFFIFFEVVDFPEPDKPVMKKRIPFFLSIFFLITNVNDSSIN